MKVNKLKQTNGKKVSLTRKLAISGIMSAAALVIQLLEFGIPIVPSFLKIDFSELPALVIGFAFGGRWGVAVCFVKNLLKALIFTNSFGIGEIANFLIGAAFVLTASLIYRIKGGKKWAAIGSAVATAVGALMSFPVNLFITYPFYYTMIPEEAVLQMYQAILPSVTSVTEALVIFNIPFTAVKFLIDAVITFLMYKKISPLLKGIRQK